MIPITIYITLKTLSNVSYKYASCRDINNIHIQKVSQEERIKQMDE
jgi:hypothetical protein